MKLYTGEHLILTEQLLFEAHRNARTMLNNATNLGANLSRDDIYKLQRSVSRVLDHIEEIISQTDPGKLTQ